MYKKIFLFMIVAVMAGAAVAGPVSVDRARRVATNFASQKGFKMLLQYGMTDVTAQTDYEEFYVFTGGDGHGFVLVSKDDRVQPILGYSENDAFLTKGVPAHIEAWLKDYDSQIQYLRENDIEATAETKKKWEDLEKGGAKTSGEVATSVGQLLTTIWGQGSSTDPTYNLYCPKEGEEYSITGCVATAMGQIMKYWNWPQCGRGSESTIHSYTLNGTNYSETLEVGLADSTFDWASMPNYLVWSSEGPTDAIRAVARLMKCVGVAVDMDYGVSGSGAYDSYVAPTLLRNFYYKHTANLVNMADFTDSEWKTLLKVELNAARPVLYAGSGPVGGHAFVFDGYDEDDLFHVNWGWNGNRNGYYAVGALDPVPEHSYTFNNSNCAIIGIEPKSQIPAEDGTTTVIAMPNNEAYGTVTGSGTYANYSTPNVRLTAKNVTGTKFVCWSDGNRSNPRSFIPSGGYQVYTAIFTENENALDIKKYYIRTSSYSGTMSSNITEWGIKLTPSMLSNANFLSSVYFVSTTGATYTVKVYVGDMPPSARLVYTSDPITATGTLSRAILGSSHPVIDHSNPQPMWITLSSTTGFRYYNSDSYDHNGHWDYNSTPGEWSSATAHPYLIDGRFALLNFAEPTNVTVSNVTTDGATVSWTAPSGDNLVGYEVACGEGLIPLAMDRVSTTANTVTLSGLSEDTYYNVYVRAKYNNDEGKSDWVQASFRTDYGAGLTNPVRITAVANEPERGTVTGSGLYESGSSVTLTATAMPGYVFSEWDDEVSASSRTVTPTADVTYTAIFERMGYPITAVSDDVSAGTVTVEGVDSWVVGDVTYYPYLSTVSLTAIPTTGHVFAEWSDGNTTNPRYCTVMQSNPTYTASFESAGSKVRLSSRDGEVTVSVVEPAPIWVYDMLGRCIYRSEATAGVENTVKLSAAGVYLVRVGCCFAEKIVVR